MRSRLINPTGQQSLPEGIISGTEGRLIHAVRKYRPVAWLAFLTASLVLFLAWMPAQMRIIIWRALSARSALSGMLLVFSLLAVSLVWSAGQRIDVWAFLFFNLLGWHPLWLDRVMLGLTQSGNGLTALALGLVLFLAGDRLGAYELILGTLTLWIVVELVKGLVRRSRPFIRVTQARIVGLRAGGNPSHAGMPARSSSW